MAEGRRGQVQNWNAQPGNVTVILNRNGRGYYAGDTIQGTVYCSFPTSTFIYGIHVEMKVKENTSFRLTLNNRSSLEARGNNLIYVNGTDVTAAIHLVGEHEHSFRFSFFIPTYLPGSFFCREGKVLYNIAANVFLPHGVIVHGFATFRVVAPLEYNPELVPTLVLRRTRTKQYYRSAKHHGFTEVEVELERAAFLVGEVIYVRVNLKNKSDIRIIRIFAALERITRFQGYHFRVRRYKVKRKLLNFVADGTSIEANSFAEFLLPIWVPDRTKINNFKFCHLLRETAEIYVTVQPASGYRLIRVNVPVTLWYCPSGRRETNLLSPPTPPTSPPIPSSTVVPDALPTHSGYIPPGVAHPLLPPSKYLPGVANVYKPIILFHGSYQTPDVEVASASHQPVLPPVSPTSLSSYAPSSVSLPHMSSTEPSEESSRPPSLQREVLPNLSDSEDD